MILDDEEPRVLMRGQIVAPPQNRRYKANLQRVGTAIPESIRILLEYGKTANWNAVRRQVLSGNLIGKGSTSTLEGILSSVYKRYVIDTNPLPNARLLSKYLSKDLSRSAKSQVLYPYICYSDMLVKDTIMRLVRSKIATHAYSVLTKDSVREFLDSQSETNPELNDWTDYLKQRWIRGFLAVLRDFGLMASSPRCDIVIPVVRTEAFMFFLMGLLNVGFSPTTAINHEILHLYLLNEKQIEILIVEAQAKGWLQYSKAGDIMKLSTSARSLEDWLDELG